MTTGSCPHLPRSITARPKTLQQADVAKRVHALPEALVTMGNQLSIRGQPFQRLAFPVGRVALDEFQHRGFQDKEAAVDPALARLRLLIEFHDAIAVEHEPAVASGRAHGSDRRQTLVLAMELQQLPDIDVADAVTVSQHERFAADEARQALQPAAGHGRQASIHEVDDPILVARLVPQQVSGTQAHGKVGMDAGIVCKVPLDHVALVAKSDNELAHAVMREMLHDVPEYRPAADLDHGLGPDFGFFREPRPHASRQDDCFHRTTTWIALSSNYCRTKSFVHFRSEEHTSELQ